MACKRNDICFKVCLMITIVPGQGVTSVIRCGDECGTSPRIDVTSSGSIIIILPLTACFSITLNNDLSVTSALTSLYLSKVDCTAC
jgi:hypothetical protein